jgi:hypothetical protein
MLKEIRIKILTYEGMYYTYAIINKDTDDVVAFKSLVGEIDPETEIVKDMKDDVDLESKLEAVAGWTLDELSNVIEKKDFIFCRPENKIINKKEIKETIINKY